MTDGKRNNRMAVNTDQAGADFVGLLAERYDCSDSTAIHKALKIARQSTIGDVDAGKALEGQVSSDEVDALFAGELTADDLDDDVRLDESSTESDVAADGGTVSRNASYQTTMPASEWAQAGPKQTWDDIRDAVQTHWGDEPGDEFEVHPSRIPLAPDYEDYKRGRVDNCVRPNRWVVPRLIVAMARSKADDDGSIANSDVYHLLDEHCSHLSKRGRKHVFRTYLFGEHSDWDDDDECVADLLHETPDTALADVKAPPRYYTTAASYADAINVGQTLSDLKETSFPSVDSPAQLFAGSVTAYDADGFSLSNEEALAEWLTDVAAVRYLADEYPEIVSAQYLDRPDEFADNVEYLHAVVDTYLEEFRNAVDTEPRNVARELAGENVRLRVD